MARTLRSVRPLVLAIGAAVALTACASGDDGGAGDAPPVDGALAVTGTDGLTFEPATLEADAGEVTVQLTCESAVAHNFVLEETGDTVADCNAGGTDTGTVELETGDYTFYCDLPGHRSAGMEGTLTVA